MALKIFIVFNNHMRLNVYGFSSNFSIGLLDPPVAGGGKGGGGRVCFRSIYM